MSSMHLPSVHMSMSVFIIYFCRAYEHRAKIITVDSRYLEVEGTLRNTSIYLFFDISDFYN